MKTTSNAPQASIHDIYVLVSVEGEKVKGKLNKQSTLEINLTKMQMMGNDGCNQFGGEISQHDAKKGVLEFNDINGKPMSGNPIQISTGTDGTMMILTDESKFNNIYTYIPFKS